MWILRISRSDSVLAGVLPSERDKRETGVETGASSMRAGLEMPLSRASRETPGGLALSTLLILADQPFLAHFHFVAEKRLQAKGPTVDLCC